MPIPKWVSDQAKAVRESAVTGIGLAAATAIWTATKLYLPQLGIPLPVAMAGGVLVFASVITAWTQIRVLDDRAIQKRLANQTSAQTKKQLLEWAHQFHLTVTDAAPDTGEEFRLIVSKPGAAPITIVKSSATQWLNYAGALDFLPFYTKLAPVMDRYMNTLGVELALLGVGWGLNVQGPLKVQITITNPETQAPDSMAFLDSLHLIDRGVKLANLLARLHLADMQTPLSPPSMSVVPSPPKPATPAKKPDGGGPPSAGGAS